MRFIQLTFYYYDRTFPEKSKSTNKQFWQKVANISRLTPYRPYNDATGKESEESSTKIMLENGDVIEVCETVEMILEKIKDL